MLMARPGRPALAVGLSLIVLSGTVLAGTPQSMAAADPDLVGVVPSAATPQILGSVYGAAEVLAVATVGSQVVVGGTFDRVSDVGGAAQNAKNLVIYDSATGIITGVPRVNGDVEALLPGPAAGTVFIGGRFTKVAGTKVSNLALVDVGTGRVQKTFEGPTFNNQVTDLALKGKKLLVGGKFTKVDGASRTALVALSSKSGSLKKFIDITFSGHHNWQEKRHSFAKAPVGITAMAVDPSETHLIAVGNFTSVGSLLRDQVVRIDLNRSRARVSPNWATPDFTNQCKATSFDSWVRDVAISPDGTYAVIVSSGGSHFGLCDSAARLPIRTRSRAVHATWAARTGGDTLLSVAIGDSAVYVGGHLRWINNAFGNGAAGAGAVPRPSLAALDPVTGLPFSWNPGRHPRGMGVSALQLTDQGLFVGGDTDYIGDKEYFRPRIALLPLHTGTLLPGTSASGPVDVYRAGADELAPGDVTRVHLGPSGVDYEWTPALVSAIDWTAVRGAFTVGDQLWTTSSNGDLVSQSFDGASFGTPTVSEPWADPVWKDVQTGSRGEQTYLGKASTLSWDLGSTTALTYADGRLFYTKDGSTALFERWFNAESGIVQDTTDTVPGVVMPLTTRGLFIDGASMYVADADGSLTRHDLRGRSISADGSVVSGPAVDGIDWSSGVFFSGPGPAVPPSP